ncbi:helix-turn-helix domain-containing protein [Paenibacillus terrae]|uniref:helix-turn-helix domain-containing protein n=1 Tax=Paenibacillus terrae TaxID=159743 RepID=UPI0021CCA29C|nr:helix-turn-helix transcriptional regulator [Paenibacillus terrae]
MNTLGQRCRNLRLLHKWTQEELANKIGVTKQVVSNWERNVARPEINHLISLAEVFDVTTDYLLCIANQMTIPYCVDSIDTIHSDLNNEKIEKSFDLLAFLNSGFRIELNGQVLEQEDLNLIGKNITFLIEHFVSPLKKRYSK